MKLTDNYNLEFNVSVITSANMRDEFAEIKLDWFQLPFSVRAQLIADNMEEELESDDEWYYISIIVPLLNGIPNFGNTYYYVDDYAPNEAMYEEFVKSNYEFAGLNKADIEIIDVVNLASALLPAKNMKQPA